MKIVTPCVLCRKNIPQGKRKVSIQATGLIGLVCHNCYMALGKSHRLVRLYSHIASLTAENERLRLHLAGMLKVISENYYGKIRDDDRANIEAACAALQPKEWVMTTIGKGVTVEHYADGTMKTLQPKEEK